MWAVARRRPRSWTTPAQPMECDPAPNPAPHPRSPPRAGQPRTQRRRRSTSSSSEETRCGTSTETNRGDLREDSAPIADTASAAGTAVSVPARLGHGLAAYPAVPVPSLAFIHVRWSKLQTVRVDGGRINNPSCAKLIPALTGLLAQCCPTLRSLVLRNLALSQVPAGVRRMRQLRLLGLGCNRVHDIPAWLVELPSLSWLSLASNHLRGVPVGVAQLKALRGCNLSANDIAFTQLAALASLPRLEHVWLSLRKRTDSVSHFGGRSLARLLHRPRRTPARITTQRKRRRQDVVSSTLRTATTSSRQYRMRGLRSKRVRLRDSPIVKFHGALSKLDAKDAIHDGFYDPGRSGPLLSLDAFQRRKVTPSQREVIYVDAKRDRLLQRRVASASSVVAASPSVFHRVKALAMFVSDSFGGRPLASELEEDVTTNLSTMESADAADVAAGRVVSRLWDGLKDVPELCHEAVTHIMHATQSMVVPLGHVRTGMCRHRALFFKYVVDTLPPRSAFPCQLVRGYRNGVPHAWNVVSIPSSASSAAAETLPHHTSCLGGALGDLADDTLLYDERGDGDEATMSAADPPSTVDYVIDSYYCPCTPLRADTPFVRSMYHAMHSISLCASAPAMLRHRVASGDAEPTVGCLLGRGQFSVVRRVSFEGYGAAVKIADAVLVPTLAGYTMAQLLHEPRMYGRVGRDCPFIVDCLGYRVFPPPRHRVHLFLEEMATTVHDVLQKRRVANVPLSDREIVFVGLCVAQAMAHMHRCGVMHRDIKSANVMVKLPNTSNQVAAHLAFFDPHFELHPSTCSVKLGDLNAADAVAAVTANNKLCRSHVLLPRVCVGSGPWMAPEVLRCRSDAIHPYNQQADVWSFGMLLLELLTLNPPFHGVTAAVRVSKIAAGERADLPSHAPAGTCRAGIEALYTQCTSSDSCDRPTAESLVSQLRKLAAVESS